MKRNSTSFFGALHPVFFMLLVYVISVFLAFFVCRMIYNSINQNDASADVNAAHIEALTASK